MSVAAAIATGTAAWYAYGAFTQAQRQADTAQQALIASDRPWLMLTDVKPVSLSSDDKFGVSFWVNMVAKNVGHSPAQNVSVSARLLIVENSGPRLDVAMHAICREARESRVVIPGQVVFPDQTEDINQGTPNGFIIPAETVWAIREARIKSAHDREMARNRPEWAEAWATELSKFPFHAPLYFTGCVNYRSSDNKLFFQTSFMFGVNSKPSGNSFPLLGGTPPVVRYPEPSPSDPEALMVFPHRMQRIVQGEEVDLGRPLYATFAN